MSGTSAERTGLESARGESAVGVNGRIHRAVEEETRAFHPRLILLHAAEFFLPRFSFCRLRTGLYRLAGVAIGAETFVMGPMEMAGGGAVWRRMRIGRACQITSPLYADLSDEIRIGDNVAVGHHVILVTTDHRYDSPERRCGAGITAPIVLEDGCWIGAASTILPGVTVGKGAIVAAGAVVAASVPPNTLVGGVPARTIRTLDRAG